MRQAVYDIENLRAIHPVFKNRIVTFLANKFIKWISVEKANRIHAKHCHLRGAEFTSAMLADPMMDVKYLIHHQERLDSLPEGAFITVSNHPIGSLDGIILIDIFASRRKDYKFMVNGILENVGAMADNFIPVKPRTNDKAKENPANINGVRATLGWLKAGHPMGFFPAGSMSFWNKNKEVRDRPWTHSVIRLIRKANVPVYPVYFDCQNSRLFYWLGKIDWRLRTLFRTAEEAFNKQGQTLNIYIGQPISPETLQQYPDDTQLADFLYQATYNAAVQ